MSGILVGVDGSDHSRRALSWAMHEAAHHHVPLTILTVHQAAVRPATEIYWNVPDIPDRSFDPEPLRTAAQEMADTVAKEIGETPPEVTVNVITGDPAEELVVASRDADMLVVGSRGRGAFAQLLMGSVSTKVAHHAACPVVVIRGTAS
jgi:nucleotide-binding universal stress UspA family protein